MLLHLFTTFLKSSLQQKHKIHTFKTQVVRSYKH